MLIQPGPLSAPRAARSLDTPSFRLIDFGRGRIAPERLLLDATVYGQDDYARGRDTDDFGGDELRQEIIREESDVQDADADGAWLESI